MTAPCPVCRAHVPTIDGNLILHRHRDQLGPCPAGQVPDPGVNGGERLKAIEKAAKDVVDRYRQLLARDVWKIVDTMDTGLGHYLTNLCIAVDPPEENR